MEGPGRALPLFFSFLPPLFSSLPVFVVLSLSSPPLPFFSFFFVCRGPQEFLFGAARPAGQAPRAGRLPPPPFFPFSQETFSPFALPFFSSRLFRTSTARNDVAKGHPMKLKRSLFLLLGFLLFPPLFPPPTCVSLRSRRRRREEESIALRKFFSPPPSFFFFPPFFYPPLPFPFPLSLAVGRAGRGILRRDKTSRSEGVPSPPPFCLFFFFRVAVRRRYTRLREAVHRAPPSLSFFPPAFPVKQGVIKGQGSGPFFPPPSSAIFFFFFFFLFSRSWGWRV